MKKIAILFLSLILLMSSVLPAFAAESLQGWLDSESEKEAERIEQIENSLIEEYGYCQLQSYPMKHIKDTLFFQKVSFFNGMDKFISDENDIVTLVLSSYEPTEPTELIYNISFSYAYDDDHALTTGHITATKLVAEEFLSYIKKVDADISDGTFGKVNDVSFLFAFFPNLGYDNDIVTMEVSFAYIQSSKGEFLVPYILSQSRCEPIIENGKIYKLSECLGVLDESLSTSWMSRVEMTDEALFNPMEIVLPAVLCIAVAVGIFFGIKALRLYFKTKSNDDYDF